MALEIKLNLTNYKNLFNHSLIIWIQTEPEAIGFVSAPHIFTSM